MLKTTYNKIASYKTLVENFSNPGNLQISYTLVLFFTIPYLFRILDKEYFRLVVFSQTIATKFYNNNLHQKNFLSIYLPNIQPFNFFQPKFVLIIFE